MATYSYQIFKSSDMSNEKINKARESFGFEGKDAYVILRDGQMYMIQWTGNCPFSKSTLELSAEAHVEQLSKKEASSIENDLEKMSSFESRVLALEKETDLEPPVTLDDYKRAKIKESKTLLDKYLLDHPLESTVHNGIAQLYNVTEKKQGLLDRYIKACEMEIEFGGTPVIEWNTTGGQCEPWTLGELKLLSLEILRYVKPLVSKQQAIEITINNCSNIDEVLAVSLDYSL